MDNVSVPLRKVNMKKNLNIGLIGPIDSPTKQDANAGTEIWTYNFAVELEKRGHNVTLFASKDSEVSQRLIANVDSNELFDTGSGLLSKTRLVFFSLDQMLDVIQRQHEFDLIHISAYSLECYLPFVKLLKKPIIATVHGFALSAEDAQIILPRVSGINFALISKSFLHNWSAPVKYKIINNGIQISDFDFSENKKDYYFWMGRIAPEKGLDDAIEFAKRTNSRLIIAGPIRKPEYFEKNIKPSLGDKIKYVGELDLKKKVDYYKFAKAFVMPIKWEEPFGLVAVESMACGTPVIAYKRGALTEIIKDGVNGFLVEPDNIDGLIKASEKLSDIDHIQCRTGVEAKYSLENMVEKYLDYYSEIIN